MAKASTREPRCWAAWATSISLLKSISGAPRKTVPKSDISIAPHLRSLENGIVLLVW